MKSASLKDLYKRSTYFRFALRSVVVSGISYALVAWKADNAVSLRALGEAFIGGVAYATLGFLTPTEPLVGPKAAKVKINPPTT